MGEVTRVLFEKPVCATINPNVGKARPTILAYNEIQVVIREIRTEGFDERSVVTMRKLYPNGLPAVYDMAKPDNWGVVVSLRTTAFLNATEVYLPIKVRWVKDGTISDHWPEDLMLIHHAMQQSDLGKYFDLQLNL